MKSCALAARAAVSTCARVYRSSAPYAMFARTVSLKSTVSWLTMPVSARSDERRISRASVPSTSTRPRVGSMNRGMRSTSVLFPAPLAPTSATISPRRAVRLTPVSTGSSP